MSKPTRFPRASISTFTPSDRTLVPSGVRTSNSSGLFADRLGSAEANAVIVLERIRATSSGVGSALSPLRQGARTASGSGSSIWRHTSGASAVTEPWCGTLNTEARPSGLVRSPTIAVQPLISRSAHWGTAAIHAAGTSPASRSDCRRIAEIGRAFRRRRKRPYRAAATLEYAATGDRPDRLRSPLRQVGKDGTYLPRPVAHSKTGLTCKTIDHSQQFLVPQTAHVYHNALAVPPVRATRPRSRPDGVRPAHSRPHRLNSQSAQSPATVKIRFRHRRKVREHDLGHVFASTPHRCFIADDPPEE